MRHQLSLAALVIEVNSSYEPAASRHRRQSFLHSSTVRNLVRKWMETASPHDPSSNAAAILPLPSFLTRARVPPLYSGGSMILLGFRASLLKL